MKLPGIKSLRDRFVGRQPAPIREFLETYFRTLDRKFRKYKNSPYPWTAMPSWRVLPSMIGMGYRGERRRGALPHGFLRDVRWGQYCLYLFIRFQDDLYDGQSNSRAAIYAADQCLVEANRVFSRYLLKDEWFWKLYHDSLQVTTQSIVEVDRLQQKGDARANELLDGYARVGEILKVGSAAVCSRLRWREIYRSVSLFHDEMAKAGQILDDLQDLSEDLERNRYNYVAKLMRSLKNHGRKGDVRQVPFLDGLLFLAAREEAFARTKWHVAESSRAVAGLSLPGMKKYIAEYLKALSKAETAQVTA